MLIYLIAACVCACVCWLVLHCCAIIGCGKVSLMALFDPKLSPRNLVLIAKQ